MLLLSLSALLIPIGEGHAAAFLARFPACSSWDTLPNSSNGLWLCLGEGGSKWHVCHTQQCPRPFLINPFTSCQIMQAYERSEQVSSAQQAATEIVEDVEQLAAILGDPVKKRRYQQQVTVFIVGYQETCGQRNSLLSQLQEFFSCSAELGLAEENYSLPDDFPVYMDDVAGTVTAALSSAEAAMSRLADLNKDIVSYVTSTLATHSPKRSHRKQVEKTLDKAKEEVVQIKHRLLQAQADVETKEQQLKDQQQLSEMKAKESRLFRAQLESTQRCLQSLEQESGAQRARLEAELRSRDSHIAELDGFLQEKAWLQRDVATEHSDQPQPVGGPLAHSAALGPGALAGPAGGPREAGKEEEDAEEESATHSAGGKRSPSRGAAAGNGAVQIPEASTTCELLARHLAALEAELAAAQLQSREDTEHWERHCRTMAAEWEEERQRLLQHTWHPVETAQHLEMMCPVETTCPAEMAQHLEMSQWGQPMKQVAMVQPAQRGETAQQLETVQQGVLVQPVETVQQTQPVLQVQLAERVETAPQMFAAGSQLTLEAKGFPELTLPPTPAGGATPSPGPTRHGGAPRAGASPDALSQSHSGSTPVPATGHGGANSCVVAFIETLRAGLIAKELHALARLLDGPCGTQMTELPAALEEAAGAEICTLLGNATLVFYSLLEGISNNDKMLLQPQDVTSDQGAPALGKGVALGGAGPLALDQRPVGGGHSSHAVPLTQGQLMSAGGGLSPRSKPGSTGTKRRAPRVLFTQQDELHNRRVLNQGVCRGQVPWGLYQDASLLMGGFRWLRHQRFEGLVRGYLAYVCMKEAEETLEQLQGSCGCRKAPRVLGRLRGLRQQRLQRWQGEWCCSRARRLQLAELLSETLGRVEEHSGLFLIQPMLPWAGRPIALTPPGRSDIRPQPAPKMLVPALMGQEVNSPLAMRGLRLCTPREEGPHKLWSFSALGSSGVWPQQDLALPSPLVITPRLLEMDLNGYLLQEHQQEEPAWPRPSQSQSQALRSLAEEVLSRPTRSGPDRSQPLGEAISAQLWVQIGSRSRRHIPDSRTQLEKPSIGNQLAGEGSQPITVQNGQTAPPPPQKKTLNLHVRNHSPPFPARPQSPLQKHISLCWWLHSGRHLARTPCASALACGIVYGLSWSCS
ncbi:uncharacterized protein LOC119862257 isoform X3 [Dermochelys coriacea]|uniref:uncharacterized protein LOC119862257 isoform X3 n=1 Tax=Dermochelys coriacea TaxID=27794 RepID=UPI001CA8BC44|nr:uncharacterized protein LOC119862257 isoform X3 [Dermochelys coriacea]